MSVLDKNECDWYCDGCGELLNDQEGFDSDESFFVCTHCGFVNKIDEDGIIDNYEDDCSDGKQEDSYDFTYTVEDDLGEDVDVEVHVEWDDFSNGYKIEYSCDEDENISDLEELFEYVVRPKLIQDLELEGVYSFMIIF